MPMTDEMARHYATEFVLQRYYLADLTDAQRKLTATQYEGVLREIDAVQAQLTAQAQPAPPVPRERGISTPFGTIQPMTGLLLVVIWAVFAVANLPSGGSLSNAVLNAGATTPTTLADGQLWRLVTACFLHANLPHIISNSIGLIWLGAMTERLYGPLRFLGIYLASGIGGSLLVVFTNNYAVGASGAILGLLAALLAGFWRNRRAIDMQAVRQMFGTLAVMLALNLGTGFIPGTNISWQGHLGGAVTGAVLALLIPFRTPRESRSSAALARAFSVALIALTVAITATYALPVKL